MSSHPTLAELPSPDLVEAVSRRRWFGRFAMGTGAFNVMAFAALTGISSFVVFASGELPGLNDTPAAVTRPAAPSGSVPSRLAFADTSTTTSVPSSTTTPADAAVMTERHDGVPVSQRGTLAVATTSSSPRARCSQFDTQPKAQAWFEAAPATSAGLDGDGDGIACEDLPGRPATTPSHLPAPTPPKIPNRSSLLRPDTRLYGVHTAESPLASDITAFASAAGKAPNMVLFFKDLDDPFPAEAIASSWAQKALPMVTLEPIIKHSSNGQPRLVDITNGVYDQALTAWAQGAAAQGTPFALRFAQEMNGNWYTWSDGRLGNGAGDFIPAWRHVHDLFDAAGANNVIWTWSVNRIDTLPDKTLNRVYPGDDYVDWVGISGYYRVDAGVTPSFDDTFARTLSELKKVAPKKLIVLTEVGAGTGETNRVAWINDFFAKLLEHPEIIGFNWFNDFKDGGDWRVGYSTATQAAFAAGVANDRYGTLVRS